LANPIVSGGVASPQSIYEELAVTATNQTRAEGEHPVGTRGYLDDGRVYYYCSNGGAGLTPGLLLAIPATTGLTRHADHDKIVLTSSYAAFAAGASRFQWQEADLDTSDIIENEYKDGYMWFENAAGAGGLCYKVRAHDRVDASGSATTRVIELFDPILTAAVATDEISFGRNRHDRVIASSTAEEEGAVGVAPITVTASTAIATDVTTTESATTTYFFWAQTWGPCAVAMDENTSAAGMAMTSGVTAGQIQASVDASKLMLDIGMGLSATAAAAGGGDFLLTDLRICP